MLCLLFACFGLLREERQQIVRAFAPLLHVLVHNQATMPRGSSGRGRIRPEDREAIDNAETVGNDIEISEAHQANVKETNDLERRLKTKREHCNRINRFILWVEEGYPEYVSGGGVKNLLEEELAANSQ